ncbi:hypothetical protein IJG10_02600 [Candidatus Saccharibacteria bacterium]|nr:hypothetical protein [Candidatus Saccharibacteria bacterium]MBQ3306252.1 hypothetical protein [Candidatus Saccharibacteria bacterium]
MFRCLNYDFDAENYAATFRYENAGIKFTERVKFAKTDNIIDYELLDRALFLSFVLIGTSYYKTRPTRDIAIEGKSLDKFQAKFFDAVYQEGLSQFAFENHLTRDDLGHFHANAADQPASQASQSTPIKLNPADYAGELILQSGGKDSLLTATISTLYHTSPEKSSLAPVFWYLGSSENYPKILDEVAENAELQIATRKIDLENLEKAKQSGRLNGHVPITYIVQSLALVQAILNHNRTVITSIGHEGAEPHTFIDGPNGERDLPVNHQWSKTWEAEKLFAEYVKKYISPSLEVGSLLRKYSELKIAELFAKNCWDKYGEKFSSCNVANYRQKAKNGELKWCGNCAKCANSYLLFTPFINREELDKVIGNGKSLFENENLIDDFKGLLGVDHQIKPFECVGETAELRAAYHRKLEKYPSLPFEVPASDFDKDKLYESQDLWNEN